MEAAMYRVIAIIVFTAIISPPAAYIGRDYAKKAEELARRSCSMPPSTEPPRSVIGTTGFTSFDETPLDGIYTLSGRQLARKDPARLAEMQEAREYRAISDWAYRLAWGAACLALPSVVMLIFLQLRRTKHALELPPAGNPDPAREGGAHQQ
jgi:hypothetical protein